MFLFHQVFNIIGQVLLILLPDNTRTQCKNILYQYNIHRSLKYLGDQFFSKSLPHLSTVYYLWEGDRSKEFLWLALNLDSY